MSGAGGTSAPSEHPATPRSGANLVRRLGRFSQWWLFLALGGLAFVLGCIGFRQVPTPDGAPDPTVWDTAYASIQLFILQLGTVPGGTPVALDIARYLAPLSVASATVATLWSRIKEHWDLADALTRSDHVVVCGLGPTGFQIARSAIDDGHEVTAIEVDPANPNIDIARAAGIRVIHGDARQETTLANAQALRARRVVAVTTNDSVNLEIARTLLAMLPHDSAAVRMSLRVEDFVLCRQLQLYELRTQDRLDIDYFSITEHTARLLVNGAAGEVIGPASNRAVTVIVAGDGELATETVRRLAGLWEAGTDDGADDSADAGAARRRRLRIVAVSTDGHTPDIGAIPQLTIERIATDARGLRDELASVLANPEDPIVSVFVTFPAPEMAVSTALTIVELTPFSDVPVYTAVAQHSGLAVLFDPASISGADSGAGPANPNTRIRALPIDTMVCSFQQLEYGIVEEIAMAKYESYQALHAPPGAPVASWSTISSDERGKNRDAAFHLIRQLPRLGLGVVLRSRSSTAPPFVTFPARAREELAASEHNRWKDGELEKGWRDGTPRDDANMIKPRLRPWDQLNAEERAETYREIDELPELLHRAGFEIVQLSAPSADTTR